MKSKRHTSDSERRSRVHRLVHNLKLKPDGLKGQDHPSAGSESSVHSKTNSKCRDTSSQDEETVVTVATKGLQSCASKPKVQHMDASKMLGVEAPDGTSFLGYLKGYQQEFERLTKRILMRRENATNRRINPRNFFNMQHNEGVVIDQWEELETIYGRHQFLFLTLLALDWFIQINYFYIYIAWGAEGAGIKMSKRTLYNLYWGLICVQAAYCLFFYYWGIRATMGTYYVQQQYMSKFCVMSVVGLIIMIFAEYVRKFNLFLFFLRLVLHLYSKFLLTLNQHFFMAGPGQDGLNPQEREQDEYSETRRALLEEEHHSDEEGGDRGEHPLHRRADEGIR